MKKVFSLILANFSEGMNVLKYRTKSNSSTLTKILFPIILVSLVMYAVGSYAYMFAEPLHKVNLTFVMLSMFLMVVTFTSFMEGMYKSQGILFDSKDNDLLFSLPLKKKTILFLRIFKLLTFQFIYNLLFLIPAYVVYIYFEHPNINFYFVSIIYLFLMPIIPTILSCIIGYVIKLFSSKFKAKKIVQTLLSTILMLGIFFLSFNLEKFTMNITENATSINDVLTKIYYPIGVYNELIFRLNSWSLIKVILINIIPFIIFVHLGSVYYFKIITKSNEYGRIGNSRHRKIKVRNKTASLIKKELTRFFSSPVYMFNTSFGIFIMFFAVMGLCINSNKLIEMVASNQGVDISISNINAILPIIFIQLIVFVGCMTSITSSSISLEGKSFNITKSLPVKTKTIFLSKIISSNIISLPLMLLSDAIFIIKFNISLSKISMILLFTLVVPIFTAIIGLIINLKYPKMEYTNDTEVVKQSASTMISMFIGIGVFALTTFLLVKFFKYAEMFLVIELITFIIINCILWIILCNYGTKKFNGINI